MFDSTISDSALRDLLRQVVLTGDDNDSLTDKMIDMERNAVFATTPLVAVSLVKETAFLTQLKGGVAVKSALKLGLNMKWLFGGLGTVCVATTGMVVYNATHPQKDPHNNQHIVASAAQQNSKDSSAFFIATPSDTFGLNPTPPVRENVTEQMPEVLLLAEETITEIALPEEPPTKGKRHTRRIARTMRKLERLSAQAPIPPEVYVFPESTWENLPEPPEPTIDLAALAELERMVELEQLAELERLIELEEMAEMAAIPEQDFMGSFTVVTEDSLLPATTFSGITKLDVTIDWGEIVIEKSPDQLVYISERSANQGIEENKGVLSVFGQPVIHNEPEAEEKSSKRDKKERKQQCINFESGSIPLVIRIPDGVEIALKTSNGDIRVSGISTGKIVVNADFGDIEVTNVTAALQATASSGDVVVRDVTGTTIARSYFGDLEVERVTGTTNVYTSSGNAMVGHITGDLSVQSDFGDVGITKVNGRTIINANSGNITSDSISGSQLKVNSNFGNATLKNITAPAELTVNSGNLTVDETVGDLTIRSQFGEVMIDDVKGNLFVYGNSGNIDLSDVDGNLVIESVFGNVDLRNTKGDVAITANSGSVNGHDVLVKEKLTVEVDFGNSTIELDNDANDLRFDVEATMGTASVSKGGLKLKKDEGHIVTEKGAITIKGVARSGSVSFD